mmetsp:Transcript_4398/g.8967  ORF Transcript_4398/g.8967 Transcript_4398/m.8967 type:complete len:83 (-) Transcript_4398:2392-2640(-)
MESLCTFRWSTYVCRQQFPSGRAVGSRAVGSDTILARSSLKRRKFGTEGNIYPVFGNDFCYLLFTLRDRAPNYQCVACSVQQ